MQEKQKSLFNSTVSWYPFGGFPVAIRGSHQIIYSRSDICSLVDGIENAEYDICNAFF